MASQNKFVAQGPYEDGVQGVGGDAGGTGVLGQGGAGRQTLVGGIGVLGVGGDSEGVGFGPGVVGIDGKNQVRLRRYLDAPEPNDRKQTRDIGVFGLGRAGVVGVDEGHNPPDSWSRDQVGVFGVGHIGVSGIGDDLGVFARAEYQAVRGESNRGTGVAGYSLEDDGVFGHSARGDGVSGRSNAEGRSGVFGHNTRSGNGVYGSSDSPDGTGVWGEGVQGNGVVGKTQGLDRCGVYGQNTAVLEQPTPERGGERHLIEPAPQTLGETRGRGIGVQGVSTNGVGVNGASFNNHGVVGEASRARSGVYGLNHFSGAPHGLDPTERASYGVTGHADDFLGIGVRGMSKHGYGATLQGGQAPLRLLPAETEGAPASGDHQVGELFVDSKGDLFFCQVTGVPGTWAKIAMTAVPQP
jgi:hypothetical protein